MSIERTLRGLESVQSHLETNLANDRKALAEYLLQSEKPFEHEERLKELIDEQIKLDDALELNKDDKQAIVADVGDDEDGDIEYLDIENLMSVDAPERFDNDNEVLRPTGTEALTP